MFPILAALLAVAMADSAAPPAVAAPDSAAARTRIQTLDSTRIVRHFPAIEVSAGRVHDLRSSATVHVVTPEALRDLPLAGLTQALALQPGVVAVGEDLHVRGGRAGETQWTLDGLTLNEPLRDRAPEVPLLSVQRADLLAGGLDAEYTGSLAGVIDLKTWNPSTRPGGAVRWMSTGRLGTAYDWVGARATTPLVVGGLGLAAAGEARLDDGFTPQRPSRGREAWLGRRFGWRNDNHLLGWAKLAPVASPQSLSLEVLGSRVVSQPFDPMFTWNDSVRIYVLVVPCELCPPYQDSINTFYRAADHQPMTESRRLVGTLQAARLGHRVQWRVAASWQHGTELTSPGLTRDPHNLFPDAKVRFGQDMDPERDPFRAYQGDWPYFKRSRADRWQGALSGSFAPTATSRFGFGAGVLYDDVESYELDSALPTDPRIDTLRTYRTRAPGGWAYVQHRGEYEGLVWNAGLRAQMFDAGTAHAPAGASPTTGQLLPDATGRGALWSFSPRLGIALPLSVRDALSASYARVHQAPPRDYLSDSRRLIYSRRPLGSPTLEPGELVSYQMAVKHLFDARWSAQVSVFHRDLFGQLGIHNDPYYTGTFRPRYANSEYGHATGFELALLAGARQGATPAVGTGSRLGRFMAGEFSLRYTFMSAYGTMSGPDGWYYGAPFGFRPLPLGEHPLDWDRGHMLGFDAVWREPHAFTLAWVTQVASGARWTPTTSAAGATSGPLLAPDLAAVNSRQLPWTERTDVALRLEPEPLHGARLLLDVRNLFDARGDAFASLAGYPNPLVNTLRDDYGGYRTDTGNGGGGYWDQRLNGGAGGWVSVNDPRLRIAPRSVRFGFEVGL